MPNRYDNFDRTAGLSLESSPGNFPSDGGSPWIDHVPGFGVWAIDATGNYATDTATSGSKNRQLVLESGASDVLIECYLPDIATEHGFVFRMNPTTILDGFLLACRGGTGSNRMQLYEWMNDGDNDGGGRADIATTSTPLADGDKISILCVGSSIKIYKNDVIVFDLVSTWQQTTGTRHGLRAYSHGGKRPTWNNFSITDLSSPPPATNIGLTRRQPIYTGPGPAFFGAGGTF